MRLTHIYVSLTLLHSCFRVLYISDEQEQNKKKTCSRRHTTTQKIASSITHLQRGPPRGANGRATHNAHKERYKGPPVSLLEENKDEGRQGGRPNPRFGRTCPASHLGAFRGRVATKSPDHLPYVRWRETDL